MYDNHSKGISYLAGFFILIAFAVAGLIFASLLDISVWQWMTGTSIEVMKKNIENPNPAYATTLKVMQAVNAVVGFFIPAVVTATMLNRKPLQLLGFSRNIKAEQVGLTILILGASLIVGTSLSYFNHHIPIPEAWKIRFDRLEDSYNNQVEAIINLRNGVDYIIALVVMAFIPALCEETLFRGGLQNFLSRGTKNPWLAIIIVSILFSLAHESFYGFLFRFFLGVVLGAIYYYSGKLWLSILAHFLNNAISLTVLFVYMQKGKPVREIIKSDTSTTQSSWGILVVIIVIGLFIVFKRISTANRRPE
ncbi:MAG: CPBP family intramembrane glutamic endopeptidase [Chitinophagaceae bacterium]